MIRSGKKLKELASILGGKNNILILETISLLREEQPFEGAIGLLASCYDNTDNLSVRKSIEGFMNDIKDRSVSIEVIKEAKKPWKSATVSMLISSCWQSGITYSDYSLDLADIFMKGDFNTAFECLTVLEESLSDMTSAKKNEIRKYIEEYPHPQANDKKSLITELLSILGK